MGILKDRTDFDFQFTYPGAFTGTASGILVLLDDAIMLEWTPSTLEIQGNYNITMACNDNKDKSNFFFKTTTNISTPYVWRFTEGYSNNTVTCYYGFITPTGDQETSQSFQFINENASSPTTFKASASAISSTASTPTSITSNTASTTSTSISTSGAATTIPKTISSSHSSSLSTGAKAGIAIASVILGVALLSIVVYFILRIRRVKMAKKQSCAAKSGGKTPYVEKGFAKSPNQPPVEAETQEMPQELSMPYHMQEMPGSSHWGEGH